MTRSEHIRALLEEYARQRADDESDQQARVAAACESVPEIAALRQERADLALSAMRSILAGQTAGERQAVADHMKARGREINDRIQALLKAAGLPGDQLSLRYRCDKCRDTGYVGEAPARFCECWRNEEERHD